MDLASKLSLYGKPAKSEDSAKQSDIEKQDHLQRNVHPEGRQASSTGLEEESSSAYYGTDIAKRAPAAEQTNPSFLLFENITLREIAPDLYYRKKRYQDLKLGYSSLPELLVQPMQFLDDLLPSSGVPGTPSMIHRNEVLFLDTETTGLGRGPGNFPFLYGLAWITEEGLEFEQYFLDGPGAEESFHLLLKEKVAGFSAICSYNGKSFDIPLIRNRFVLLGERFRAPPAHLDLFHFWKSIGGGMRKVPGRKGFKQKNMEEEVLGFFRKEDLPGSEVPQVYFDYRKYGRKDRMHEVLKHNEWDLQGLALLFLKAVALVNDQRDQVSLYRSGIARMFLRHGRTEESRNILAEITETHSDEIYTRDLLYGDRLLLGMILKREKRYEEADSVFRGLFRKYRCMQSCIELSRYREFRTGEIEAALAIAREGLDLLEFRGVDNTDRYYLDLKKRTSRLEKRLKRMQASSQKA